MFLIIFHGKKKRTQKQTYKYHIIRNKSRRTCNLKQSNEGLKPGHLVVVVVDLFFSSDGDGDGGGVKLGQIQVSLELAPKAVLVHRIDDGPSGVGQHLEALKVHLTEGQVRLEVVSG